MAYYGNKRDKKYKGWTITEWYRPGCGRVGVEATKDFIISERVLFKEYIDSPAQPIKLCDRRLTEVRRTQQTSQEILSVGIIPTGSVANGWMIPELKKEIDLYEEKHGNNKES